MISPLLVIKRKGNYTFFGLFQLNQTNWMRSPEIEEIFSHHLQIEDSYYRFESVYRNFNRYEFEVFKNFLTRRWILSIIYIVAPHVK